MANKNIIIGMRSLSEIREKNGIYIDKTRFIEELENNAGTNVPVFLRPRRFGKSLTVSMLLNYYDICKKELFDKNFKGTWIYDHRTPLANSFYVLRFDFSDVSSVYSEVNDSFTLSVASSISRFSDNYPELGLTKEELDPSLYKNATDLLSIFLTKFQSKAKAGEYLYVIIDEYDHFANGILTRDKEDFKDITSTAEGHEGLIKRFYALLKKYYRDDYKGSIDRFFITGVSSVSLDSVTSGFNIATNLSDEPSLNSMVGFTYHELSEIIDRTLDFTLFPGINKEQLLKLLEENYDGYTFAIDAKETVFNSNLCLSYLRKLIALRKLPSQDEISLNDDAGKLQGMLSLCDDNVRQELINSMFNKIPIFATLPDKMNLNTTGSFDKSQTVSLLYHLGYLTIEHERSQE